MSDRLYKIRQLTVGNKSGDSFGITIPRAVAERFDGVNFSIAKSGTCIILTSGANYDG